MTPPNHTNPLLSILKKSGENELYLTDASFSRELLNHIDAKGLTDAEVYKRAHIDRKLFSKIRNGHIPRKKAIVALALALELNYTEAAYLLSLAGFALSPSLAMPFDIIIINAINNRMYSIDKVNELLHQYELPLLGE